ncbi:MAG: ketol-acid reductoisomerase [Pseudomonadota bacterium]
MATIHTDQDASPAAIGGGTIAIIGYGSQGRSHARNLRDSGFDVIVGARAGGEAEQRANADGFSTVSPADATKAAVLVALLTPDMSHRRVFEDAIAPNLAPGSALLVAHGFSTHYGEISPGADIDIILVAPKGPGDLVRREYEIGRGVPCLFAVQQDATGNARAKALAYAQGIGGTRAGAIETTFAEETETDLFGEQAVLCGGASELVNAGFETLVEAGYQPEVAYFECLHELKLIVDLMYEGGLEKMLHFISETAKYGDFVSGPRVINAETRARMREVLLDIQTGKFAQSWIAENAAGKPEYDRMYAADRALPLEATGKKMRAKMAWLEANRAAEPAPQAQAA